MMMTILPKSRKQQNRLTLAILLNLLGILIYQDRTVSVSFFLFNGAGSHASNDDPYLHHQQNDASIDIDIDIDSYADTSSNSTTTKVANSISDNYHHHQQAKTNTDISPTNTNAVSVSVSVSIVVQLSGEMGNHLSKIAFAKAVQWMLQERFGIESHLILQRQARGGKWVSAMHDVKQCFPNLRRYDFELGNTPEFHDRLEQQRVWLGNANASQLVLPNLASTGEVDQSLSYLASLLPGSRNPSSSSSIPPQIPTNHNISMPFVYAQAFVDFPHLDRYYDKLRNFFVFDEAACCKQVPDADESVFHFRNFLAEMPRKGKQKGFEELSPNATATKLFAHLQPGDKIAMTSRRRIINNNNNTGQPQPQPEEDCYVQAFQQQHRQFQVRVIYNQTGVQDFCFLTKTQKDMAGMARSTFFLWAAILGNGDGDGDGDGNASTNTTSSTTISRLYSIDSPDTRKALGDENALIRYNWTNPNLQSRLRFVHYSTN